MTSKITAVGNFLALSLLVSSVSFANGFKAMAKELSQTAKKADVERVAVLPFVPLDGTNSKGGWSIAEKLTTQIVRVGKVQTIERSLLRNLMDEQKLARTGLVDPATLKKLGKILSVDGVVAGSFTNLGQKAVVNARLINVETGVIISAVEREIEKDWLDTAFSESAHMELASLWVPMPESTEEVTPLPPEPPGMRDAPADDSCTGAAERVERLEEQILDIKAHYWAGQLKKGASLANVKVNLESTITAPILKKQFYDRLQYWFDLNALPALTPFEVERLVSINGKAYSLYQDCVALLGLTPESAPRPLLPVEK